MCGVFKQMKPRAIGGLLVVMSIFLACGLAGPVPMANAAGQAATTPPATTPPSTVGSAPAATTPGPAGIPAGALSFFDSGSFDNKLSSTLRAGDPEVYITFAEPLTVNRIPPRLDKWLAAVEKYGGKVELKPEATGSRGILGAVIDLILGIYDMAKEKILYGPAEKYNVDIFFQQGTGVVTKMVFVRKPNVAPETKTKDMPGDQPKETPEDKTTDSPKVKDGK